MKNQEYAGFWIRTGAAVIDSILIVIVIAPIMTAIYGDAYWNAEGFFFGFWDILFNYVFPVFAIILFWIYKSATPGKIVTKLTIVDAKTGKKPSTKQFIIRYLGYYVSSIPLMMGIIWVAFDKRKQGWHDKIAGTVVVRHTSTESVKFEN